MKLNLGEIKLIESILSPSYAAQSHSEAVMAESVPDRDLLEKVGGMLVEAWRDACRGNYPQYKVRFTDRELICLRERLDIRAKIDGDTEAGIKLKVKVYEDWMGLGEEVGYEYDKTVRDWHNEEARTDTTDTGGVGEYVGDAPRPETGTDAT